MPKPSQAQAQVQAPLEPIKPANYSHIALLRPTPNVWRLNLSSPPDNRLTPELLSELSHALDVVESEWRALRGGGKFDPKERERLGGDGKGAGALILGSGVDKFWSNGLDWARSLKIQNFFEEIFDPVTWRILTFPLVTIAAINGHAFAGGMILALSCDYRIMTSGKGYLCMNELAFGSPLPNSFNALLALRIPNLQQQRDTLMARRWTQPELLKMGLLDEIVEPGPGALDDKAVELGVREGGKIAAGSWGAIKRGIFHPVLEASQSYRKLNLPPQEEKEFYDRVVVGKGIKDRQAKL
ncbi:enoyl-CoA hydratase/isomerase [Kwoniella heveanensis BCC8398]|uniref:Enoyl-CoA hydratase/isomerase n=1 Tax=Kwoniella heveanensis BCC8398 TaxID=1296120 RepID=A0A1B9GPG8_9TREE|nr:enoyl-CoA hydratase/isomerase [Kwoniella heveanensis BCC8398]